jgi:hypothetical protein
LGRIFTGSYSLPPSLVAIRSFNDLGSGLPCRITDRTLRVVVVFLVLGTPPVLDVVALALHDPVDAKWRAVLAIVVEATTQLSLLALAVMLVDVTAASRPCRFLSRLARRSTAGAALAPGWLTSSWIVGSLLCTGRLDWLRECWLDVFTADLDAALFSSTRAVATRTCAMAASTSNEGLTC